MFTSAFVGHTVDGYEAGRAGLCRGELITTQSLQNRALRFLVRHDSIDDFIFVSIDSPIACKLNG